MSATKKRPEAPVETAASNNVMRPGKNGGMLRMGGKPGNRGGGRKPSQIRKKALRMLANRMGLIGHLADGVAVQFEEDGSTKLVSPKPGERLQALKLLAELGMGEQVAVSEVKARMRAQVEVLRDELPPELFERITQRLGEVWA